MSSAPYLTFDGDMVSSSARTSRHASGNKGKPRGPIMMREVIRTGRWANGDMASASDLYEIGRHLKPGQSKGHYGKLP